MAKMATWRRRVTTIEVGGREVKLSNPGSSSFPSPAGSPSSTAEYYIAVEEAAVNQLRERPGTMKRFVDGVNGEFFFQKRVPKGAPDWLQTATFRFPSGRTATSSSSTTRRTSIWAVNLGVVDFNPHPVRRSDLDRPDELRVDLDPMPGRSLEHRPQGGALCPGRPRGPRSGRLPEDLGLSRHPRQRADRAALGLRRGAPGGAGAGPRGRAAPAADATCKWWKEERHGVFVDYNQNARDRTIASGYSVRPVPDARVCCPIEWDEVPDVDPCRATARHGAGPGRRRGATRRRTSTTTRIARLSCSTSPSATRPRASATPLAAALPQAGRRAQAGAAVAGQEGGRRD